MGGSLADEPDAVAGGRLLLVCAGVATVGSAPLLGPDGRSWIALLMVSAAMTAVLLVSLVVPWSRLPARATLLFPGSIFCALAAISIDAPGLIAPLTGLLTLCFAYLGLTQPPGTSMLALPAAVPTYLIVNGSWTVAIAVRLMIAVFVWVLLAELLARLTSRQATLTAALRRAAHIDALTGVPNRRDLEIRMTLASPGDTLVMCDLDNFKALNDTLGHHTGDRVLTEFGALLRTALRAPDYCARYGGEEFFLLLAHTDQLGAQTVLARLHRRWDAMRPAVTFSAGFALCRADRTHLVTLAAADQALYEAKLAGRNTDRAEPAAASTGSQPTSAQVQHVGR